MELSHQERLDLKRLVAQSDCEDNTENIRRLKHSNKIAEDILSLTTFLQQTNLREDMTPSEFEQLARNTCPFLVQHYLDIFIRIMKNELNLPIMARLLQVLQEIEEGRVDQHEGSVVVGKILKDLYLDSAIRHGENLDKEHTIEKTPLKEGKPIFFSHYVPYIHSGIHISGSKYGMFVFATHAVRTHQKTEHIFIFIIFVIG